MNYKSIVEKTVLRRKAELVAAASLYDNLLTKDEALYKIEKRLRGLAYDKAKGEDCQSEIDRYNALKLDRLSALGVSPLILTPPPRCLKCGDTGLLRDGFCECVVNAAIAAEKENIALPLHRFEDFDSEFFEDDADKMVKVYKIFEAFSTKFPDTNKRIISLLGKSGTGKTHLAGCIADAVLRRGFSVVFITAFAFNSKSLNYHTSFDKRTNGELSAMTDCDLLLLDDLGTESLFKNVTKEYLYLVINERIIKGKHTLITSNLSVNEIGERYGERIASRLFDKMLSLTYEFEGTDKRKIDLTTP